MVKHIILWQLKDELSDAEKAAVKAGIKEGLEGLVGKVPGLLEVHVNINGLPTSNADVMLDRAEAINTSYPSFFEASGFYKSSIQPVLFEFTVFSITEFLSMRAI